MKAHQKSLDNANKQMPKGETHFAQIIRGDVQKQPEQKLLDGLTPAEVDEAEKLMDPQAYKVLNIYQSKKGYAKEIKKLVDSCDLILEILDARDPEGCRNPELEKEVLEKGKKLVLVLSKADLIDEQNATKWVKKLSKEHPTLLFSSPKTKGKKDDDEDMQDEEG